MNIEQIMTKRPETIAPTATVREALRIMQELDVRHLPVVSDGELVGILSDRDTHGLLMDSEEGPKKALLARVADIMQSDPITVESEDDVADAIELLLTHKVGALPVLDAHTGNLCGIVSYVDILKASREFFGEVEAAA